MIRMRAAAGLVALAAMLALVGCTASGPGASPASTLNPAPDDNDESQDTWAHLKDLVVAKYPDAEHSALGSSAKRTSFHLSPATTSGTTGVVVAVSCRGGDEWTVRVDDGEPGTTTGTCDGTDPEISDAVGLGDHATGVRFTVSPPDGVRFWMVAFYTKG